MTSSQQSVSAPARRSVVAAVGAVGVAAALTACGSSGGSSPSKATGNAGKADGGGSGSGSGSKAEGGGAAGKELAKTADIPVGGGKIFGDAGVVVTQPQKGEFKAFTNICTHRQCPVSAVEGGTINCPCHGSKFSIEDGSPKPGSPATTPLAAKQIKVTGDSVELA
ncbi:Rieske (2Fe-2S) protein [Streptomyces sp. NPDC046821]|uniref:Rieske (2Fe-2S) protein n=1 Tax=Streptomyces sp. NPDC046821 TaxID=3154702 RepID=UPI0033E6AC75